MQNIESLRWIDHVRKRPGMYVGDLRLTGFKQMLEYLFEEILKSCLADPVFEIEFHPDNRLLIKIRNVDTRKFYLQLEQLQNSDDKLTSFGLGVFIGLSADFSFVIHELPSQVVFFGQNGNIDRVATTSSESEKSIWINYIVDKEIFKDLKVPYEHINSFVRQFALLNPGLKIISIDKTTEELQRNIFYYPAGIFNQLDYFLSQQHYGQSSMRLDIDTQIDKYSYKIGIAYSTIWCEKSFVRTYAGNIETYLGGSLQDGALDGLLLSIKELAKKEGTDILINKKLIKDQLILIAAVRGEDLIFHGSIKRKLGMPKLKKDVRKLVFDEMTAYFNTNPKVAGVLLGRFRNWNQDDDGD